MSRTDYPLALTIQPPCGSVGTTMTATVATKPNAQIGITVAYEDGKDHGNKVFLVSDPEGRATYRWVIPPDAPTGEAHVLATAATADGGNTGVWPFQVASPGEC